MAIAAMIAATSCSKDDKDEKTNTGTTTKEERDNIENSMENMSGVIASMMTQEGFLSQVGNKEFVTAVLPVMYDARNLFDVRELTSGGKFNYQQATGSYVWDAENAEWTVSDGDAISFSFPSATGGANDCNVTINGYTDQAVTIDGQTAYLPTSTSATFTKDGARLASMTFNATYAQNGVPESIEVASYSKPFTTTTSVSRASEKTFTFTTASVDDITNSRTSISANFNIPESQEDLKNVVSDVVISMSNNGLTFAGTVNANALAEMALQNKKPTVADINEILDIDVEYAGRNVGKLNIEETANGFPQLTIEYKDGTTQNANSLLDGLVDMILELDPEVINKMASYYAR